MSQALRFWKDCWIYTNRIERANIKFILQFLKKRRSVCLSELLRHHGSEHSMRNALLYLLAARVLRVQQHKEVRVYSLTDNWLVKLKKLTEPYQHNNYKAVDSVKVEDVSTEAGGENG